ncbi:MULTISPECIES: hypothetical protein [unclassified Rathayibacter]|uniref:hypothetical protein n=1 Tax=unclassified Rathayibacter TaxID=2609250 RepID=UPI0006FA138D|nr:MULTISPECIES: hypothetical protein [unclassified Rathayibacter]KQQ00592.1 hypothetical protein ASF42_14655 [Rathayibacter sp. Leaf294]KQS10791.1 hypothetical protein ASG06_14655 [Rathayibacter sp. Leaf185]
MTDARLPGRWLTDPNIEELSDKAWRVMTGALMWSNEQGTDGEIPRRTLRLLHPENVDAGTVLELVRSGFWEAHDKHMQILGWDRTQTRASDVEWQRERNRQNQAAKRRRDQIKSINGRRTEPTVDPDTGEVTGDVSGDDNDYAGGQDRTGKDRTGTELRGSSQVDSWPVATIPRSTA